MGNIRFFFYSFILTISILVATSKAYAGGNEQTKQQEQAIILQNGWKKWSKHRQKTNSTANLKSQKQKNQPTISQS